MNGISALLTMINSCANGIAVVNIDNGYGAGLSGDADQPAGSTRIRGGRKTMSRQLYFECASGISGDMTVAALLDLGAEEKTLRETLGTLPIEEPYEIHISRVKKSSLDVCDFLGKLAPGRGISRS